jgi:GPI-GlcNAc transferase complex, PIG-H component
MAGIMRNARQAALPHWETYSHLSPHHILYIHTTPSHIIQEFYVAYKPKSFLYFFSNLLPSLIGFIMLLCLDFHLYFVCLIAFFGFLWTISIIAIFFHCRWGALEKWTVIRGFGFQMTTFKPISSSKYYRLVYESLCSSEIRPDLTVAALPFWHSNHERFFSLSDTSLPVLTEAFSGFHAQYFLHVALKSSGNVVPLFQVCLYPFPLDCLPLFCRPPRPIEIFC